MKNKYNFPYVGITRIRFIGSILSLFGTPFKTAAKILKIMNRKIKHSSTSDFIIIIANSYPFT